MATMSTNVWWSSQYQQTNAIAVKLSATGTTGAMVANVTVAPEPPHENKTIQRMSEAWRKLVKTGG